MPERRPRHATPRWVWVGGIITVALVTILVILLVAGGSSHGPGRHLPAGEPRGMAEPTSHAGDYTCEQQAQAWS